MLDILQKALVLLIIVLAIMVFMLPIYFAFAKSPDCMFLFLVSWIPAVVILYIAAVVDDL